jgi:Na+-translocating ferredoxin:NAD+ oxidoreductase subunit C
MFAPRLFGLGNIRGGVHPDGRKDDTSDVPILTGIALPERLYIPLNQSSGDDALPLVKPGEQVLKGQLIGKAAGRVSACIHAPTSGKVVGIEAVTMPHPSGLPAMAIIIEPDGEERWVDIPLPEDPFNLDPDTLASKVEEAGIVGMGGAIFPAAIKLRQGRRFEIQTLIINGSECEPFLTTDDRLMQERADEIVEGTRLIRKIIEAYRAVIAIEDNKPAAIAAIEAAAAKVGAIEVMVVPAHYPMGSAKQLIQAVTGLEVPAGKRSNDVGVLVHNVATALAIQQALVHGRPLLSRVTTVSGDCVAKPQNVEVLFGTPIRHIFKVCGGLTDVPARLLMGGPMMGQILPSLDVPVIKGSSGILALSKAEVNAHVPSPCIRCARCVEACPMGLVPLEMARNSRADKLDAAQEYGLRDCILCGSCAYVCPSHIPLVQYFEYAKGELADRRSSQQKQEYTKGLIESRKARVEEERLAKEAAKAAKEAAKAAKAAAKAAKEAEKAAAKAAKASAETAASGETPAASSEEIH